MYPIPSTEKLIETKTCRHCRNPFPITDKDLEFYDKVSPVFAGKKCQIPAPMLCPDCRQQRRLSFRNERKLYKRKCDATGKDVVSIYSPDKLLSVYHFGFWRSDAWDPMSYWYDFDFHQNCFEQLVELFRMVPKESLFVDPGNVNCDYANALGCSKDCYLIFDSDYCDDCLYGKNLKHCTSTVDALFATNCEHCYEILDCSYCYGLKFAWWCNQSHTSQYVVDLDNAHHCFLSHTVYNDSYIFENQKYTQEEYEQRIDWFQRLPSHIKSERINKWISSYTREKVYPYHLSVSFENSSGSGLVNAKNVNNSYDITDGQDCKYSTALFSVNDVYDVDSFGDKLDLSLEVEAVGHNVSRVCFSDSIAFDCSDIYYSHYCFSSSHLFWCIGLRNKQYYILNKQYTKEEYESLVPKIIEHMMKTWEWWEFFPSNLSPFGYNETVAQEYYPMTREQILPLEKGGRSGATGGLVAEVNHENKGGLTWSNPPSPLSQGGDSTFAHWPVFNWSDYEPPFPKVEKIIPASKLPQDIKDIPDDILNWAIECEVTKKPFRIIKQELEFYRKHNLPIPRRHPDQRHLDRMAQRNPRKLFERKCDCCHKDMITTYAPERPERVYCEECYNREVIG